MARVRFVFDTLSLFEDEEAGDTHLAVYASLTAADGTQLAAFRWNNLGTKVDEVATYNLGVDPGNSNVVDVELAGTATLTVSGFTDDDNPWPDEGSHENALGSAAVVLDSRVPSTLGDLLIGPTRTMPDDTRESMVYASRQLAWIMSKIAGCRSTARSKVVSLLRRPSVTVPADR